MAASTISMAQNGKASTTKKTFSRETTVSILIDASIESVWDVLIQASEYQRWNSTIISLEGIIQTGEKVKTEIYT